MELKIIFKDKNFKTSLINFQKKIEQIDTAQAVLKSIGQLIANRGKENIEDGSPDGVSSFQTLAPSTILAKGKTKPLEDSGQLKNSISYHTQRKSLFISMLEYGIYHQSDEPREKLPRRPFLNLRDDDFNEIKNFITNYLKK